MSYYCNPRLLSGLGDLAADYPGGIEPARLDLSTLPAPSAADIAWAARQPMPGPATVSAGVAAPGTKPDESKWPGYLVLALGAVVIIWLLTQPVAWE